MPRLQAIFVAICVVLIAGSVGAVSYLLFGVSGPQASVIALAAMTALAVYNLVSARLRDREDVSEKITDLSRGTADLARQVAELGRQVIAMEQQEAARRVRTPADPLAVEIGELGVLVKQLAETVAAHEARFEELAEAQASAVARQVPEVRAVSPAEPAAAGPRVTPIAVPAPKAELPASGPFKGKSTDEITEMIRGAIEANRIDLYLQPIVTLPQRKVRYYEAMTRLRTEDGTLMLPADFLPHAEKAGLIGRIDNVQLFRCVQVLRRLLLKNREIGLFCNVSALTLNDPDIYRQFLDFLEANRALATSLMLEFSQDALRTMGPLEQETMSSLLGFGFRFSMDRVSDLRMGPRDLSDLGVRFVKVPAQMLLNKVGSPDIHAADLSDLLGRHGISLIAERIETEAVVVDLLDYDVRYGQGFLFSPPRPVRAEALASEEARGDSSVESRRDSAMGTLARAAG